MFALPVWLADLYVRDLRELAAAGDAEAAGRLEALAPRLVNAKGPGA